MSLNKNKLAICLGLLSGIAALWRAPFPWSDPSPRHNFRHVNNILSQHPLRLRASPSNSNTHRRKVRNGSSLEEDGTVSAVNRAHLSSVVHECTGSDGWICRGYLWRFPRARAAKAGDLEHFGPFWTCPGGRRWLLDAPSRVRSILSRLVLRCAVAPTPNHEFAESGALECEPGCLQSGYPYGLPRLTDVELAARFRRFRGNDSAAWGEVAWPLQFGVPWPASCCVAIPPWPLLRSAASAESPASQFASGTSWLSADETRSCFRISARRARQYSR